MADRLHAVVPHFERHLFFRLFTAIYPSAKPGIQLAKLFHIFVFYPYEKTVRFYYKIE